MRNNMDTKWLETEESPLTSQQDEYSNKLASHYEGGIRFLRLRQFKAHLLWRISQKAMFAYLTVAAGKGFRKPCHFLRSCDNDGSIDFGILKVGHDRQVP